MAGQQYVIHIERCDKRPDPSKVKPFNVIYCLKTDQIYNNAMETSLPVAELQKHHNGTRHYIEVDGYDQIIHFCHQGRRTTEQNLKLSLSDRLLTPAQKEKVLKAWERFNADPAASFSYPWLEASLLDRAFKLRPSELFEAGSADVHQMVPAPPEKPREVLPGAPVSVSWMPGRGLVPNGNKLTPVEEKQPSTLTGSFDDNARPGMINVARPGEPACWVRGPNDLLIKRAFNP